MKKILLSTLRSSLHNTYIAVGLMLTNFFLMIELLKNFLSSGALLTAFWPVVAFGAIGAMFYKLKFIDDPSEKRNAALARCINALDDLLLIREQGVDKAKLHAVNPIWDHAKYAIEQARKVLNG